MSVTIQEICYPSSIDSDVASLRAKVAYPTGGMNLPVVVLMHGWRETVATFDQPAIERFAKGRWLTLTGGSSLFATSERITGDASAVTATVVAVINSGRMRRITVGLPTGAFVEGETVTGTTSGATATIERITATEAFAIFAEMRGRGGSSGAPDGGGREVQDIVDAITYVLDTFPAQTDATQIHAAGYSGGGGNIFSLGARFPDFFNSLTAHFGISDYGYDPAYGWYFNGANLEQSSLLESWIGDPVTQRANYKARASVLAITNYSGGWLRMYHDTEDASTPVHLSQTVASAFDEARLTNYALVATTASDNPRAIHGLPNSGSPVTLFEPEWMSEIAAKRWPAWTIPEVGAMNVAGWLDTRHFTLWLGDGLSAFGRVVYDVGARAFTIEGDNVSSNWLLKLKNQTAGAVVTATLNGALCEVVAGKGGIAAFSSPPS